MQRFLINVLLSGADMAMFMSVYLNDCAVGVMTRRTVGEVRYDREVEKRRRMAGGQH